MAKTISKTITGSVYYSAASFASANPLTIATNGAILAGAGVGNALSLASGKEWTVVNDGTISAASGYGISTELATITNNGLIASGSLYGVKLVGDPTLAHSVIINSGTITDSYIGATNNHYSAVDLASAGELTNQSGGLISGASNGVLTYAGSNGALPNAITNLGRIEGGSYGISAAGKLTLDNTGLITGGSFGVVGAHYGAGTNAGANVVTNSAGGTIEGGQYGLVVGGNNSTVVNAGTIGGASYSVIFKRGPQSGYTGLLTDEPGAVFAGAVNGGATLGIGAVLELASGASTGTLTGLGLNTGFYDMAGVSVNVGAHWSLTGSNSLAAGYTLTDAGRLTLASVLAGTGTIAFSGTGVVLTAEKGDAPQQSIAHFKGNTVALIGVHETIASFGGGHLTLGTLGGAANITLAVAGSYTTGNFTAVYASGETVLTACYAAGTEIETAQGPVAVEHLRAGMRLRTASGALRRLRWLGQRHHAAAEVAARDELRPVRIAAGSLGDGLPRRDLRLSPEHALLLDGVLVPAIQLLGVPGITQEAAGAVTYFHVELDTHDAILAEGAAAETYIDAHSGAVFDNADTRPTPPVTIPCAPRIVSGPVLGDIRRRLGAPETQRAAGPRQTTAAVLGHVETCIPGHIAGWALQPDAPEAPVHLLIAADGIPCGTALANGFRFDLRRAGLGQGNAAFSFTGPIPAQARSISVTRQDDGTHLPGSPFTLAA